MNAGAPLGGVFASLGHFTHGRVAICDRDHIIKRAGRKKKKKSDREKPEY